MATLGQVLRTRRIELGLTQEELAERIGGAVRQAEISRLENDHVTLPRRERLERFAEVLEIPLGVLLAQSGWVGADEEMGAGPHSDSPFAPNGELPPETTTVVMEKLSQVQELVEEVQALVDPAAAEDRPDALVPVEDGRPPVNGMEPRVSLVPVVPQTARRNVAS